MTTHLCFMNEQLSYVLSYTASCIPFSLACEKIEISLHVCMGKRPLKRTRTCYTVSRIPFSLAREKIEISLHTCMGKRSLKRTSSHSILNSRLFARACLFLAEHNITARILMSPENRLSKGAAYHWDMLVVAGLIAICSIVSNCCLFACKTGATINILNER